MLTIALVFRRPLIDVLAGQVGRMKAGPFEVEWRRAFSEIEVELGQEPVGDSLPEPPGGGRIKPELDPVARRAPIAAVLEGSTRVEIALRGVLEQRRVGASDLRKGLVGLAHLAQELNVITEETANAIEGLSVLRNLAAHGQARDVSPERANEYLALADGVVYAIESNARSA